MILFNSPSLPGEPGKWLIPNDALNGARAHVAHLDNAFIPGTGRFTADLAVADLDYNATKKDTLALKYFYQHDPTVAPYSYSSVPGFTEHLDSGAQVFSITNTSDREVQPQHHADPRRSAREELGATTSSPSAPLPSPAALPAQDPSTCSARIISPASRSTTYWATISSGGLPRYLNIGPNAEGQSSNTGVFQNRLAPSGNAIWMHGKHTHQLWRQLHLHPTQHHRQAHRQPAPLPRDDFSQFIQGFVTPGSSATGFYVTSFLQGNASRYYRANQLGTISAGQVPDHADPLADRRRAL